MQNLIGKLFECVGHAWMSNKVLKTALEGKIYGKISSGRSKMCWV